MHVRFRELKATENISVDVWREEGRWYCRGPV